MATQPDVTSSTDPNHHPHHLVNPPTNPRFRANTLPMGAACGKKREVFAYLTIANHSEHTNREI